MIGVPVAAAAVPAAPDPEVVAGVLVVLEELPHAVAVMASTHIVAPTASF
ncbi:MAG TPA: hypothetical protein VH307_16690 [Streptosporangiaceae bacterium]|nr:hypothetical protein [Streptosporangiaceae bacterium]